jgi:predicted dehydrogenase
MIALTRRAGLRAVPYWDCGEREVLIDVVDCLPLGPSEDGSYVRHGNEWKKVIAYAFADGPGETIRKVVSRRLEEKIRGSRELVVAFGTRHRSEARVLALGTRHPKWVETAPFHEDLVFDIPGDATAARMFEVFFGLARRASGGSAELEAVRRWLSPVMGFDPASGTAPELPQGLSRESLASAFGGEAGRAPSWAVNALQGRPLTNPRTSLEKTGRNKPMGVALIGAGNYARTQAAHHLRKSGLNVTWIVDRDPVCAALVGERMGVAKRATTSSEAFSDPGVGLVVLTSFHDSHTPLACVALSEGKRVFIEKPPAITQEQLRALLGACGANPGRWRIGYNRRYAPAVRIALDELTRVEGPTTVLCTVREATIPRGHWYYWPNQGTRILGNLCHWIDLGFLLCARQPPVSLCLSAPEIDGRRDEEVGVGLVFKDNSAVTVIGTGRGDGSLGVRERIEVRRGELTIVIEDFRSLTVQTEGRTRTLWNGVRDRGHGAMFRSCAAWSRGEPSQEPLSYDVRDLWIPNRLAIEAAEMAASGKTSRSYDANEWD